MKNISTTILWTLICLMPSTLIVAADDDFEAIKSTTEVTIDGIGNEQCWDSAQWYPLNFVWIPYDDIIAAEDFTGRFKISWTEDELLLLVEIVDDSLHDGHANPTDNYWNDDCVEVFLDEDHSGGNHQNNYNAWAYHISKDFDVADNGDSWDAMLFNDHVNGQWIENNGVYTWEIAIKIFDDSYTTGGSNSPVMLSHGKEMGFSLAYCDTDGSPIRENFIGSKYLQESVANDSYINASIFGTLTLIDSEYEAPDTDPDGIREVTSDRINVYPNPSKEFILIDDAKLQNGTSRYVIFDIAGNRVSSGVIDTAEENFRISTIDFSPGRYVVQVVNDQRIFSAPFTVIN